MKTIDEIRRNNLLTAISLAGSATALSDLAGVSAAYLSQIKNRTPESKTGKPKAMGDEVARKIEVSLGKAPGWMDNPCLDEHAAEIPSGKIQNEHIQAVIKLMESTDDKGRRKIRDAAEETLAEYDAHLRRIGVKSVASQVLDMSGLMSSSDVFSKNKEKEQN